MRKDHRFADAVPMGENWRHKYLIDLDGMGYSARLFALVRTQLICIGTATANTRSSSPRVLSSSRPSTPSTCRTGSNHG
jgi:hypothetical protein